jgi:hypothetical protein
MEINAINHLVNAEIALIALQQQNYNCHNVDVALSEIRHAIKELKK